MPEIQFTPFQESAISENAPKILVSAAAGSGKTTVLTERLIRKISHPTAPVSLSEMLIVTYTKAATADLKEQIEKRLVQALAKNPSSTYLSRQLSLLPSAQISTIHSFCFQLIKRHFQQLSLPASLRIADESEGRLLATEVMEVLLEDLYEQGDSAECVPNFNELVDQFVSVQDTRLSKLLLSIYNQLLSIPNGVDRLKDCAKAYDQSKDEDFLSTAWGQVLLNELDDAFGYNHPAMQSALNEIQGDDAAKKKYGEHLTDQLEFCQRIKELLSKKDYESIAKAVDAYQPKAIKTTKCETSSLFLSDALIISAEMKKYLKKAKENGYFPLQQNHRQSAMAHAGLIYSLACLLEEFDRRFCQEKLRRGLLDYSDLERLALRLLIGKDGLPTNLAREVSSHYREIYIDEYQDVNEVQDLIFTALSCSCQRFMVGDIKQSIYAFRGSAPYLFASYRRDPSVKTIFLAENFRSDKSIIDFCNHVFDHLFCHCGDEMPYDPSDALVCKKRVEDQKDFPCELAIVKAKQKRGSAEGDTDQMPEAKYVAKRISEMIVKEGVSPSEIVILLRSPSSSAPLFEQALRAYHISCTNKEKESLLENEAVLLLLSLLKIIDNPLDQIALAATLRSPIFGMTMSDLIRIRSAYPGNLYRAVCADAEENKTEKSVWFLEKLKQYRAKSLSTPIDRLIWDLIEDTGIDAFSLSEEDGRSAKQALLLFYDYARTFENGSFQGLSNFLSYMENTAQSKDGAIAPVKDNTQASAVRIVSMHSSKGLQFPICFVCGLGKRINTQDATAGLLLDKTMGMAMKLSDDTGFVQFDTPCRQAVSRTIFQKAVCEEMRILYVALTRAKHRMIMTGSVSNPAEYRAAASCAARNSVNGNRFALLNTPTYLFWILTSLSAFAWDDYQRITVVQAMIEDTLIHTPLTEKPQPRLDANEVALAEAQIRHRYDFTYPHRILSSIPAKVTVSRLCPDMLDEFDTAASLSPTASSEFKSPAFLSADEKSGAQRGTATHQFMQFCDFDLTVKYGIGAEVDRLIAKGFLPKQTKDLIDQRALAVFFDSPLFAQMKNAAKLRREIRFNTFFPAASFSQDPALTNALGNTPILVQGVIDCFFIDEKGKCVLIDYKTDRIPREILGDPDAENEFLADRHRNQLGYYRIALARMLTRKVDRVLLYSFALGRTVDLTDLCPEE